MAVTMASEGRPGSAMGRLERELGVCCRRIACNDEGSIGLLLQEVCPQVVVFDGFNVEERYGHFVRRLAPGAMRVLDMQDFHALRLGREALVEQGADLEQMSGFRPDASSEELCRELAAVHRCDCTLAITGDEQALLVDFYGVPASKVCAAPFGYPDAAAGEAAPPGFAARHGAMFIGNWRHRPNRDAAQWLVREVWPRVHAALPDVELRVYGANPTPEDMAMSDPRVNAVVAGTCGSVAKAMRRHRLLVAPLRYGAGLKGKVADAFRHGLVPVTTWVGAEGLVDAATGEFPGCLASMDAGFFAEACVAMYTQQDVWERAQARGSAFFARTFDAEANNARLGAFLEERLRTLEASRRADFVGQMLWLSGSRWTELMAKYIEAKASGGSKGTARPTRGELEVGTGDCGPAPAQADGS